MEPPNSLRCKYNRESAESCPIEEEIVPLNFSSDKKLEQSEGRTNKHIHKYISVTVPPSHFSDPIQGEFGENRGHTDVLLQAVDKQQTSTVNTNERARDSQRTEGIQEIHKSHVLNSMNSSQQLGLSHM